MKDRGKVTVVQELELQPFKNGQRNDNAAPNRVNNVKAYMKLHGHNWS